MAVSTVQGTAAFSALLAPLASCVPPALSAPAETGHAGRLTAIKERVDRDKPMSCPYPANYQPPLHCSRSGSGGFVNM
jgi:hypothetical protein